MSLLNIMLGLQKKVFITFFKSQKSLNTLTLFKQVKFIQDLQSKFSFQNSNFNANEENL